MYKKYYQTDKEYLAKALAYIGYNYMLFTDNGITIYSFVNSKELRETVRKINNIRHAKYEKLRGDKNNVYKRYNYRGEDKKMEDRTTDIN